jgi:hypothetical protein
VSRNRFADFDLITLFPGQNAAAAMNETELGMMLDFNARHRAKHDFPILCRRDPDSNVTI